MRTPCCHTCLAFVLKFLNFLQAFIGISIIIYSAFMLNQWQHHRHEISPPPDSGIQLPRDVINSLNSDGTVSFNDNALHINFHSLPAPWFIYASMGIGILVCCITCIGHIAAEAINGCCLCFYAVLTTIFVLLEVGLVVFIAVDRHWEKDLPFDPTGELDSLRTFIEDNVDVFEWVGIAIVIIQALSLLFAIILRSLVSSQRADDDIEGDYSFRSNTREPLLTPYPSQASGQARGDSDIWSSRMREKKSNIDPLTFAETRKWDTYSFGKQYTYFLMKYRLNSGDAKHNSLNQNPSTDVKQ